jgi:non-homologous end joining protein Ku
MQTAEKLLRKQFLIYPTQAKKIELIARRQKISAAEMVRQAIDAFDPDAMADMTETELLELVHARVKEAITETRKTRERIAAKLNTLEAREG